MPDPTGRISHLPYMHRGVAWKEPVRCATTGAITIATALNAGDTIDNVTLVAGDRVLVKDQATGSQNGIYVAGATPARAYDMDQDPTTSVVASEVMGAFVFVIDGDTNGGKLYHTTNETPPTLGTDDIDWAQWSGGGMAGGTPALTLGTTNAAGAAATAVLTDATVAIFDATVPTTADFSDAAATGSAAVAARRDHRHGMPAAPTGGGGIGELLITETPSTPLIFADILQNEAQDDLLYADT